MFGNINQKMTASVSCDVKANAAIVVQHPVRPYLKYCVLFTVTNAQKKMNRSWSRGGLLVGPGDTGVATLGTGLCAPQILFPGCREKSQNRGNARDIFARNW